MALLLNKTLTPCLLLFLFMEIICYFIYSNKVNCTVLRLTYYICMFKKVHPWIRIVKKTEKALSIQQTDVPMKSEESVQ